MPRAAPPSLPCPKCGAPRAADAARCPKCGLDLTPFPGHTVARESVDLEESLLERVTALEEQVRKANEEIAWLVELADTLEAELVVGRAAWLSLAEALERRGQLAAGDFRRDWAARLGRELSAAKLKEHFLAAKERLAPPPGRAGERWSGFIRRAEGLLLADELDGARALIARAARERRAPALESWLGLWSLLREDWADAARHFSRALPEDDGRGTAALGLATAEYLRGRHAGARAAALLIPQPARRQLLLGLVALATGAPKEAARAFASLAEKDAGELPGGPPGEATWLYFWARALAAAGEPPAAAAALDEALARDPHHRSALAFRAWLALQAGAKAKAKSLYAGLARLEGRGEAGDAWRAAAAGKAPEAPPPFTGAGADDLLTLLGLTRARAREIVRETAQAGRG